MSHDAPTWERVRWHQWEALRAVAGEAEMIVGVSAGPRILSLRWRGGPNLLHRDETDFGVGEWRLFGGHRLSVAPESPTSYVPDNAPCLVQRDGQRLHVERARGSDFLRRALSISATEDGFAVEHIVENCGPEPWRGAVWAITCVTPEGCVVSPCAEGGKLRSFAIPTDRGWERQWSRGAGCVITRPRGLRGKAGWHSAAGWLALLRPDATFMIHSHDEHRPHGGCDVEVFTGRDYLEMETLAAETTLLTGERATHLQHWLLLPGGFAPKQWREIGALAGCRAPFQPQLHAA